MPLVYLRKYNFRFFLFSIGFSLNDPKPPAKLVFNFQTLGKPSSFESLPEK